MRNVDRGEVLEDEEKQSQSSTVKQVVRQF